MNKGGKSRCKMCAFVEEASDFEGCNRKFRIHFSFYCDLEGLVYQL